MKELISQWKKTFIILSLIFCMLLTSCTGARELDTLGIVIAVGIDIENGKILVTNEVINPASGKESKTDSSQDNTLFVQGIGNTVEEAIINTSLTFDRRLYYPHNYLVILGEEFAKAGIGEHIDILSRGKEQREHAYMLVAKGTRACDVMGINSGISKSSGRYIYQIIEEDIYNGQTRTITINEFLKYHFKEREEYILGVVRPIEKPQINKNKTEDKIQVICVEGGAVFKEDTLVGYYMGDEMLGFNFLIDDLKMANISFESPKYLQKNHNLISEKGSLSSVEIFRSKTKKSLKVIDGRLHLFIDVEFRGLLAEETQGIDISKPGMIREMEKACGEKVKSHIANVMNKAQKEFGIDTFGIGELVHRKYPKLWKEIKDNWSQVFVDLDYTINVKVHINDTGFTNTPPNIRKDK